MNVVERYLKAVASFDWDTVRSCVAEDVRRVGPYGDTYEGRDDYVKFLSELVPALAGYRMDLQRVTPTEDGRFVAELSETVEMDGRTIRTPECIVVGHDDAGLVRDVCIYIQTLR